MRPNHLRRREFVTLLGGTVAWPLGARAQQPAMPAIGFLYSGSAGDSAGLVAAFGQGLNEGGYAEGRNVTIEYRWAEGRYDLLPALAVDLVARQVAVIAALTLPSALAAKAATSTIPIVFYSGGDPVKDALVASFSRPAGNLTGVSLFLNTLGPKRLELVREMVPNAAVIGVLINPSNPNAESQAKDAQQATRALGLQLHIVSASSERDFDAAFASLVQQRANALVVAADPFLFNRRHRLVALAALYAVPAVYDLREYATAGGLISYGNSLTDAYRQVGIYTGRILKGAKPADLPVMQPTKFDLVINLKTAKALGLEVPATLLALADEVID
jgi:putative tryptophan/tyrosine transport system substrate-binding protein